MWILKLRYYNENNILNKLVKELNIDIHGYPLSSYQKGKEFLVNAAGTISGTKENKHEFLRKLKKSKEIKNIEINGDFFVLTIIQPISTKHVYSPELIHIEPVKLTKDFWQEYYLGSWNRESLSKVIDQKIKGVKCKILKFKKEKIKDISITSIAPQLTNKQRDAFKIALKERYYDFPRKTELGSLAKLLEISISTYQAHLRKAENKIMNFFYKYFK